MKITVDTTDEQLNKPVEMHRTRLIQAINDGDHAEGLSKYVNALAESEGERAVYHAYRHALQSDADHEAAFMHTLQQHLLVGPNDTWSGRGNDARRSRYDGVRHAVGELRGW